MNDNRQHPPRLDKRGRTTPDCRASILACHDGAPTTDELFDKVLAHLGVPEEVAGPDILAAMHLACRCGLLTSNRFDPRDQSITFGPDTCLGTSDALLAFVWPGYDPDDEGDAA